MRVGAAARENNGHTGPYGSNPDLERAFAADDRDLADFDPRYVGDCIEWTRRSFQWHSQGTRALSISGMTATRDGDTDNEPDRKSKPCSHVLISILGSSRSDRLQLFSIVP